MKFAYHQSLKATPLLLCLFLISYSSCKKVIVDPIIELTPAEITTALLKGSAWTMAAVKVDDVVLDLYKGLTVSFTEDGKYSSANGGKIWPASGTWKFKNDEAKAMIREDGLEITIDAITDKAMTISFTQAGGTVFEPGRNQAVGGKHVLTMGR